VWAEAILMPVLRASLLRAPGAVALCTLALGALALCALAPAAEARSARVAAVQVALTGVGLYGGAVDGVRGPRTARAIRRFQRRKGLAVDGVVGPQTRRALGRRGRPLLGRRAMRRGHRGWDVAALQFMLARRGHPAGSIDGGFGPATAAAVRRFQRAAGLAADGVAGPATLRALRRHRSRPRGGGGGGGPVAFFRPVHAQISSPFGMRWGRPHQGIDFAASSGARVAAAGRGTVRFAGWNAGGYGGLVIVTHRLGFETWYAHLSRVTSYPGEPVVGGTRVGLVGSTGHSTGPHLHFEVRLNGTPIDPMPRLLATAAGASTGRPGPSLASAGQPSPAATSGCDARRLQARARRAQRPLPTGRC